MSTQGLQNNLNTGDVAYYNGKQVKVVSSSSNYVTIEDSSGKQIVVNQNVLKNTPLFSFNYDEALQKRKEQIAYYQQKGEEAGEKKNGFLKQIKDLLAQMRLYDKSDEEYQLLKDDYWAARMSKTAAGNREYGAYLSAAMIASDPIA